MQIPIKSGFFGRTITRERIVRVAKGAVEHVQKGKVDDSEYMGPFDKFHDLYCNQVKSKLIKGVHGLASNTAVVDRELGKAEEQRNQGDLQTASNGIETNKKILEELMPGRSIDFGYDGEGPRIDGESYLVYSDQTKVAQIGFPLYLPVGPEISLREPGAEPAVPTFRTAQDIQRLDLAKIRMNGKISCAGKLYRVRFSGYEPILLTGEDNRLVKELQTKLSTLGIQAQAILALNRLAAIGPIDTALMLPSVLPGNDEGQIRTKAELAVMASWVGRAATATTNLQGLSQYFEDNSNFEKNELDVILRDLTDGIDFPDENRKKFSDAMLRLDKLQTIQSRRNVLVLNIKKIYRGLYELGRRCESPVTRACMEERVKNFNSCFEEFVSVPAAPIRDRRLQDMISSQLNFLTDFSVAILLDCEDLLSDLPPGEVASRAIIDSRKALVAALKDHSSTRTKINNAMENLRVTRAQR